MISVRDFWQGRGPRCIGTVIRAPAYRWSPPEQKIPQAAEIIRGWEGPEINMPPAFYPDYGTVTTARPWGGQVRVTDGGHAHIVPVADNLDALLSIQPGENPDLAQAVRGYREVVRLTGRADVRFLSPDHQGVLNTAALVMDQTEFMIAMLDQPDRLHEFLEVVYDSNLRFIRALREQAGRLDGSIWPHIWLPDELGVTVTEDYMPLLSPEQYRQFGLPYLRRQSEQFGGLFIHCCGPYGRHVKNLAESGVRVLGLELRYPYTTMEEVQEHIRGVVLVPYVNLERQDRYANEAEFYVDCIRKLHPDNRLWFALTDRSPMPLAPVKEALLRAGVCFEPMGE